MMSANTCLPFIASRKTSRRRWIAEKVDIVGRHVRQTQLCDHHARVVLELERLPGIEILYRRKWR
jgi:hypothetical protein